jgi:hypothetical protein
VDCAPSELLRLTQCEGQPWLCLHALLLEPELRRRYILSSSRKGTLQRVRKFLNEVLLDQLPLLAELQRFLDEAAVCASGAGAGDADAEASKSLLLEAVPEVLQGVLARSLTAPEGWAQAQAQRSGSASSSSSSSSASSALSSSSSSSVLVLESTRAAAAAAARPKWSWADCAAHALQIGAFRRRRGRGAAGGGGSSSSTAGAALQQWPDSEQDGDLSALGEALTSVSGGGLLDEEGAGGSGGPICSKCGEPATKRCSRCQNDWYCSRECQVAAWKGHKVVCDVVAADMARKKLTEQGAGLEDELE